MANQVTRWQPFNNALTLRDAMDRLFEDSFVWPRIFTADVAGNPLGRLPLNMYETPDEVVVKVALPGAKPENLNIQFQDGRLIIDATIPEQKYENVTWHYREMGPEKYHTEVALPVAINTDKVDATLENGILTLHLPKAEEVKPKKIQVKAVSK